MIYKQTRKTFKMANPNPKFKNVGYSFEVHPALNNQINETASGIFSDTDRMWHGFGRILETHMPVFQERLDARSVANDKLTKYHRQHGTKEYGDGYLEMLRKNSIIADDPDTFEVQTQGVDDLVSKVSGSQMVVPASLPRLLSNGIQGWIDLNGAFYGSDVIANEGRLKKPDNPREYNSVRGAEVVKKVTEYLDQIIGLENASYSEVTRYGLRIKDGKVELIAELENGEKTGLKDNSQFKGYRKGKDGLVGVIFEKNGLAIELKIDKSHKYAQGHPAGVYAVMLQSITTTIVDLEDSVISVDGYDLARDYKNWDDVMIGTLEYDFGDGRTRGFSPDIAFVNIDSKPDSISSKPLQMIRHTGIHIPTDAVRFHGNPIPQHFLDMLVTTMSAMHNFSGNGVYINSPNQHMYVVLPKFQNSFEVGAKVDMVTDFEKLFGLPLNTILFGLMDEEHLFSLDQLAALHAAQDRAFFINTGFLDRSASEMWDTMTGGAFVTMDKMMVADWMKGYEKRNVDIGLITKLYECGQIGKGMYTLIDEMANLLATKDRQVLDGANTAWVPNPTGGAFHALHYLLNNVNDIQADLLAKVMAEGITPLSALIQPAYIREMMDATTIQNELYRCLQSALGFNVRTIELGIGCSGVYDIDNRRRMEDRATVRRAIAWIIAGMMHGLFSDNQIMESMMEMSDKVDEQNIKDNIAGYVRMSRNLERSFGLRSTRDMIFSPEKLKPNGLIDSVLINSRREIKGIGPISL